MLADKQKYSIKLLRKHEETALKMNPDGYYLAFSGGKDSQVIYELCRIAGVKFKAHFSCTTVDPKEVLRFIHEKYPDVIWHRPEKSMFKLIEEHKSLPLRHVRYCCRLIKEIGGIGNVVVTGIRKAESIARSDRKEVNHSCVKGVDKIILSPILEWRNAEVWDFVRRTIGYHCVLYDIGFHRIGCVLCPNASPKVKMMELKIAPRFEYAYKKAIKKCMDKGSYSQFRGADEVFAWWIGGTPKKTFLANRDQSRFDF